MSDITLLFSTGNQKVDHILQGVITLYEMVFPSRIRSYYLVGSYADGSATPTSDIDLQIWFKEGFIDQEEKERARQLREPCWLMSPLDLDLMLVDETVELQLGFPKIKLASVLLYGEDIRNRISLMPIDRYGRLMMHAPYKFLARARGNPDYLVFPLNYPDPEGEFYGYDSQEIESAAGGTLKGMKELIMVTGVAASAITALRAGVYTEKKGHMARLYREHINDEWTPLLTEIYEKCNRQWGYLIPEEKAAQQDLRRMCRQVLAFENHFLTIFRDFLLAELEGRTDSGRWFSLTQASHLLTVLRKKLPDLYFTTEAGLASEADEPLIPAEIVFQLLAITALAKMIYPDEKVLEALERVKDRGNELLRQAATETIQTIQSHISVDSLR